MSNEESSYLSQFDQFHEPVKLLPFIVQSTANIKEPFIDPESMLLAIDFKRPDLIRQIRAMPSDLSKIPAVALTAFATEKDRQLALSAGYQLHLAKPVEPNALVEAITDVVNGGRD